MEQQKNTWRSGLEKSRKAAFGRIATFLGISQIDRLVWDELEGQFIQADLGIDLTHKIITTLQEAVAKRGLTRQSELKELIKEELSGRLISASAKYAASAQPEVILLVGVNGSGKTTTAAKLARHFLDQGKKVSLVAGDTYRAAAMEQLGIWAKRLNVNITTAQPGSDPGAVVFDGIRSAISKKMDFVIVDTAGRLHTRFNLMEELKKVARASGKAFPGAPHAVWLIIDATTGQNALQQAKAFLEAVHVTGIIVAKLDSSAKGGMVFAIQDELKIPILFAGLGENPEDFIEFDPKKFVENLLGY